MRGLQIYIKYTIGDRKLSNRDYSYQTYRLLNSAAKSKNVRYHSRLLDYCTQKYGFNGDQTYLAAVNFHDNLLERLAIQHKRTLLQIFLLNNDIVRYNQVLQEFHYTDATARSLVLNKMLRTDIFYTKEVNDHQRTDLFKKFQLGRFELQNIFRGREGSYVVVGNGPQLVGRGLGAFIDNHQTVIRFNEFETDGFEEDYGAKTDIWIVNKRLLADRELKRKRINVPTWVICSNNYEYKNNTYTTDLFEAYATEKKLAVIPPEVFQALIARLDCLPSSGMAFAYWAFSQAGAGLDGSKFLGFSHLMGKGFTSHYFRDTGQKDHIHQWQREKQIFQEICA